MPKVSVNIVTKDRAQLLIQALNSVLEQRFKNYEVVVVNDASTDNTQQVIENYQTKFPSFVSITNPINVGVRTARDQALKASQGEYIAVLDDDDVWIDNGKLGLQVDFLNHNPSVGAVGTWAKMLDMTTGQLLDSKSPLSDQEIRERMLIKCCLMNQTVMFRKSIANEVGGYELSHKYCEDYSLWLRMGTVSKLQNLRNITTQFRIHNKGLTETTNLSLIWRASLLVIKYRTHYPNFLKSWLKWIAQYFITLIFGINGWEKLKKLFLVNN